MFSRRKKKRREIDDQLLSSIFRLEADWKRLQQIMERSYRIDYAYDSELEFKLKQATYMFLLREAKHRNLKSHRY